MAYLLSSTDHEFGVAKLLIVLVTAGTVQEDKESRDAKSATVAPSKRVASVAHPSESEAPERMTKPNPRPIIDEPRYDLGFVNLEWVASRALITCLSRRLRERSHRRDSARDCITAAVGTVGGSKESCAPCAGAGRGSAGREAAATRCQVETGESYTIGWLTCSHLLITSLAPNSCSCGRFYHITWDYDFKSKIYGVLIFRKASPQTERKEGVTRIY